MEIRIENTEGLAAAASQFVSQMGERRVFAFYGKMGAGKTTFIKAVCEVLGVEDAVASPTFAIVNEYRISDKRKKRDEGFSRLFHFDFYRIRSLREAYDIGCEEYFYSGCPCFIEWPELIEPLLPEDTAEIRINVLDNDTRLITIT